MEDNKDVAEGPLLPNKGGSSKSPNAYENLTRGLTPDELSQTGTQKLILNDLMKAEKMVAELQPFRDMYHEVCKEKSVLDEKLTKTKNAEVLYSFCITSGGIIIGLSKIFYDANGVVTAIMIAIGALLIIGGILFKTGLKK
jgi:hypothetical protein